RQARFQVAIADMDRLRQTAATDAPRTYPRLTALRERIESASNIAGRPQNIQGLSTVMDTRQFDMSKRSLDGLIQAAQAKPELAQQAYVLTGLKKALVNRADESTAAVPGDVTSSPYYRARGIFSSRAELLDAAQQGRSLMRGNDTAMAGREFGAMSGPEQRMFRQGVAYEVRRMLGDKAYGEDTTRLFKKPNVQEVMALAFPANTAAFEPHAQFNRFVAREGNMQKTFQMGTKGSDTARIEAGKEDLKNLSIFGRAMRTVGPENAVWV